MQPLRLPLNCLPQHDTHSLSLIRRLDISSLDLVSRSKSVTAGVKSPHVTKEPADSFGTSERGDELAASIFAEHESEDNKQCIASHRSPPPNRALLIVQANYTDADFPLSRRQLLHSSLQEQGAQFTVAWLREDTARISYLNMPRWLRCRVRPLALSPPQCMAGQA